MAGGNPALPEPDPGAAGAGPTAPPTGEKSPPPLAATAQDLQSRRGKRPAAGRRVPALPPCLLQARPERELRLAAALWLESPSSGLISPVVATGVNHASSGRNTTLTFIAGTLLGLAGGPMLAAVSEALHARD